MSKCTPWYEDEDFWETIAPIIFQPCHFETAAGEVSGILELVKPEPGARVLDLGCGTGRHSTELAKRGFRVVGVDRNESYIERAGRMSREAGVEVEYVRADMREFCCPGEFDLILNLFTAFGYFEDMSDDRRVADCMAESLAPGGAVVMATTGLEILVRDFRERDWQELDDGTLLLEERRIEDGWRRVVPRWIMIRGTERYETEFPHHPYSAFELRTLLESSGFARTQAYGGLDGSKYDESAKWLVAVGRVL